MLRIAMQAGRKMGLTIAASISRPNTARQGQACESADPESIEGSTTR